MKVSDGLHSLTALPSIHSV